MPACPNCGTDIPDGQALCPHCGARRAAPEAWPPPPETSPGGPGTWPPPPSSLVPKPLPPERLLTGRRWLDVVVGIVASLVGFIGITALGFYVFGRNTEGLPGGVTAVIGVVGFVLSLTGLLTPMLLTATLRTRLPLVAKGARWCLTMIIILITTYALGAFVMCAYTLNHQYH